jgi:ABC-2 type transport system permease protein
MSDSLIETQAFPSPLDHGSINWLGMWTLFSKEIRRFMKVYLQTLISPMITTLLFLAVFALSVGRVATSAGGVPFMEFLGPGLIMMAMVQNAFANTSSSLTISKIQGNIVDLLMAPLSAAEQMVALAGGGVVRGLVVGLVVGLSMLPFVDMHVALPWLVLYHAIMGCLLLSLLGLMGGIWADKFDHLAAVTNFIITPLSFLSGTFYSTEHLPPLFQSIALANPFFYMIDGFRAGFTGHADGGITTGILVLAVSNLVLLIASWRMLETGYKLKS